LAKGCNPTIDMSCYWETTAFFFCPFIDSLKVVPVLGELDKLYALSFMVAFGTMLRLCSKSNRKMKAVLGKEPSI